MSGLKKDFRRASIRSDSRLRVTSTGKPPCNSRHSASKSQNLRSVIAWAPREAIELADMVNIKVKKLYGAAQMPRYAHVGEFGDLAADMYALVGVTLGAGETLPVATGIAMEFPSTHGALVEDRSGLAVRGVTRLRCGWPCAPCSHNASRIDSSTSPHPTAGPMPLSMPANAACIIGSFILPAPKASPRPKSPRAALTPTA